MDRGEALCAARKYSTCILVFSLGWWHSTTAMVMSVPSGITPLCIFAVSKAWICISIPIN